MQQKYSLIKQTSIFDCTLSAVNPFIYLGTFELPQSPYLMRWNFILGISDPAAKSNRLGIEILNGLIKADIFLVFDCVHRSSSCSKIQLNSTIIYGITPP